MAPLPGLRFLLRQRIGGVAEQQICILCRLQKARAGGGVAGEHHAQPPARCAQHLYRLYRSALHGNALPFLQQLPLLHRHPQRPGLLRRKFACTGQLQPVAKAFYPVLCGKRHQPRTGRPALAQRIQCQRLARHKHLRLHRIGQRAGQCPHSRPDIRQALRTQQGKRPCAVLRPQCLQKARQTKDVVAMVVGQADGIRPHQVHACPVCRCLSSLAAVPEQAVPAAGCKRSRKRPVRQRHGSSGAQQCDGKHKDRSPCTMYLLRFYCTTAGPVAQSVPAAHRMAQHSKKGAAG